MLLFWWDLVGEFFGGVGPDFGEGGVVVGDAGEGGGGGAEVHGNDDFVDEFGGFRADAEGAEDFAGFGVGEHFDEAVGFAHGHGFAVVVEGVGGGEEGDFLGEEFGLGGADGGDLGVGEDAEEAEAVMDVFEGLGGVGEEAMGVAGGDFSLLDGEVDDVEGAGDVAGGEDVGLGGLLGGLDDDFLMGEGDAGGGEVEGAGVGMAAKGDEDLVGGEVVVAGAVGEVDLFEAVRGGVDAMDLGAAVGGDAALGVGGAEDVAGFGVESSEELVVALDEGGAGAHGIEVMGEFEGDGAAAEDDAGGGEGIGVEDVVAGPVAGFGEAGDGGDAGDGAGGDAEGASGEGEGG